MIPLARRHGFGQVTPGRRSAHTRRCLNEYVVTPTPESLADRKLIDCIRLLVVLGYANAAAHWYVGADAGRQELPEHEHILALALNLSAVGEAAVLFHKLVHDRVISQDPAWHGGVKEAWKFLHSPEVQSLRDKHLRFIRDKVSFHADPEPVMHYLTEAANAGTSVILWETTEHNRGGYPRVSAEVVAFWLMQLTANNRDKAQWTGQVYNAIWRVAVSVISTILEVKTER